MCCNLVTNGHFEQGTASWSGQGFTVVNAPYVTNKIDKVLYLNGANAAVYQDISIPGLQGNQVQPILEVSYRSAGTDPHLQVSVTPGSVQDGPWPLLDGGANGSGTLRVQLRPAPRQFFATGNFRVHITGSNVYLDNIYVGYGFKRMETANPSLGLSVQSYGTLKLDQGIAIASRSGVGRWYPNAQQVKFSDSVVSTNVDGPPGAVYRLYRAAFGRVPDAQGLGYQIAEVETLNLPMSSVARNFINSPEFQSKYGSLTTSQFITQLYANVLNRAPDAGGLQYHVDRIDGQGGSRADTLIGFSESPENKANVAPAIRNGIPFTERQITPPSVGGSGTSGSSSGCNFTDRISAAERTQANACGIQVSSFVAQADLRLQQIVAACQRGLVSQANAEYNDVYAKMILTTRNAFEATSCGTAGSTGIVAGTSSPGANGFGEGLRYHVCTMTYQSLDALMAGQVRTLVEAECAGPSDVNDTFCGAAGYNYRASYETGEQCNAARVSLMRR